MVLGSQIAFAAGSLAALRALRFRGPEDVGLIRRRVSVALGAGALTAAGSALYAANFSAVLPDWWVALALAAAMAAALPLGLSAFAHARARTLVVSDQPARGLSADLGPLAHPALLGGAAAFAMVL